MTPIVHITDKEQALMRENERLTDKVKRQSATIHVQAVAIQAMTEEIEKLKADLLPIQRFTDSVIGEFPEHGDIDGFTLQDMAESCGLLVAEDRTKSCCDECTCFDSHGIGLWTCYRVQPVMRRAREASARFDAAMKEQS